MAGLPLLSPHSREILLDALRPPAGYRLDHAVGTSYSVDLLSGLLVPMAFALFDTESDEARTDPVAVLAATQTYASRVSLYCEQGLIASAKRAPRVLAYLEETLKPVPPPRAGSFHPKVWVLRFASDTDGSWTHRVLCLSRNLTFDRSWDTILRLEQGSGAGDQAKPLIAFLRELNELSPSEHASALTKSLRGVEFDAPRGFASLEFVPMTPKLKHDPIGEGDRLLVVSPFLGAEKINDLCGKWTRVDLASRAVSMDQLGAAALTPLHNTYAFSSLDEDGSDRAATSEHAATAVGLAGLHAKVYAGEAEGRSFLVVGSANCGTAAFDRNYEFGVRLNAKGRQAAPATLLRDRENNTGLRALLEPYDPPVEPEAQSAVEAELDRLDLLRREIAAVPFRTVVRRVETGFELALERHSEMPTLKRGDTLRAWPITLGKGNEPIVNANPLATWSIASAANVTALICFELSSSMHGVPALGFTLKTELVGDLTDEERLDEVLATTLDDPKRLMQFLLLLLAAGADDHGLGDISQFQGGTKTNGGGEPIDPWSHIPLMETLVRTYAREPGRLEPFRRAIDALAAASRRAGNPLPELEEIWKPIDEALGTRPSAHR